MHSAPHHLSPSNWNKASPKCSHRRATRAGWRRSSSARPNNERQSLADAQLTPEGGIDGDRWVHDSYYGPTDGRSDPRCQVSLMNARFLRQIAGAEDAMCLAGDNLIVDLDLSEENLPAGSRLAIGDDGDRRNQRASPTRAARNFSKRYGERRPRVHEQRARQRSSISAAATRSIVTGGTIAVGDSVRKRRPS